MTKEDLYNINKCVDEMLEALSYERNLMNPKDVEEKLRELEREEYKEKFLESMCCNLNTCRYNQDGVCKNKYARKECVDLCRKVLCMKES